MKVNLNKTNINNNITSVQFENCDICSVNFNYCLLCKQNCEGVDCSCLNAGVVAMGAIIALTFSCVAVTGLILLCRKIRERRRNALRQVQIQVVEIPQRNIMDLIPMKKDAVDFEKLKYEFNTNRIPTESISEVFCSFCKSAKATFKAECGCFLCTTHYEEIFLRNDIDLAFE